METLTCPHCGNEKPDADFYSQPRNTGRRGRSSWCKDCTKSQNAGHKREHPELRASPKYFRDYYRTKRLEAIKFAGGECVECGIDDPVLLDFDHVDGSGHKDRRGSYTKLKAIMAGEVGWQLLCGNCHRRKTYQQGDHLHNRS